METSRGSGPGASTWLSDGFVVGPDNEAVVRAIENVVTRLRARAADSTAELVVLAGPTGTGKTRLTRSAAAMLRSSGHHVVETTGTDIVDAFVSDLRQGSGRRVEALLTGDLVVIDDVSGLNGMVETIRSITHQVRRAISNGSTIVAVETTRFGALASRGACRHWRAAVNPTILVHGRSLSRDSARILLRTGATERGLALPDETIEDLLHVRLDNGSEIVGCLNRIESQVRTHGEQVDAAAQSFIEERLRRRVDRHSPLSYERRVRAALRTALLHISREDVSAEVEVAVLVWLLSVELGRGDEAIAALLDLSPSDVERLRVWLTAHRSDPTVSELVRVVRHRAGSGWAKAR